eukprot:7380374-Prymnesium_polylepis.1
MAAISQLLAHHAKHAATLLNELWHRLILPLRKFAAVLEGEVLAVRSQRDLNLQLRDRPEVAFAVVLVEMKDGVEGDGGQVGAAPPTPRVDVWAHLQLQLQALCEAGARPRGFLVVGPTLLAPPIPLARVNARLALLGAKHVELQLCASVSVAIAQPVRNGERLGIVHLPPSASAPLTRPGSIGLALLFSRTDGREGASHSPCDWCLYIHEATDLCDRAALAVPVVLVGMVQRDIKRLDCRSAPRLVGLSDNWPVLRLGRSGRLDGPAPLLAAWQRLRRPTTLSSLPCLEASLPLGDLALLVARLLDGALTFALLLCQTHGAAGYT